MAYPDYNAILAPEADTPVGFGALTTGGYGGEVVEVNTTAELKNALCDRYDGTRCIDDTPRIIRVKSLINFKGSEGLTTANACVYSKNECKGASGKQERILDWGPYCQGKTLFPVTYDTAAANAQQVGSNKTLIGIGAQAGIMGKGLYIGGGASNIIIRNLSLTDINEGLVWAGDAITINNGSRIWIDHNRFARIGRQMIVTGWETAKEVTISNNYFDGVSEYGRYCNDRHYWAMLLNAKQQEITIYANHFHMLSGRSPELGKLEGDEPGVVHLVSNLYTENYYVGASTTPEVPLFAEANHFQPSGQYFFPIFTLNADDLIFAPLSDAAEALANCSEEIERRCEPNFADRETSSFKTNDKVLRLVRLKANWRDGIASVEPIPHEKVYDHVTMNAGPQTSLE